MELAAAGILTPPGGLTSTASNYPCGLHRMLSPEQLLPTFDIFALSSDTEQIPNAVLEAMAAGLPIAAFDVGDVAMMVAPQNRPYVVQRDLPHALAEALRRLADDAALRARVGAENREKVAREFAQERMFREYEEILLSGLGASITQST